MTKNEIETIIGLLTIIAFLVYAWFVKDVIFVDSRIWSAVALLVPMVWSCIYVSLVKEWKRQGRPYTESIHVVAQTLAHITAVVFFGGLLLIAVDKIS